MEYCCHCHEILLVGVTSCYLDMLDKLQKQIYRTVSPSLATSLEPLDHCQNVASLSFSYSYYFVRCLSELAELVPLPRSHDRSTGYSNRLHEFSVAICRCYEDVYVNSFFPLTTTVYSEILCLKNVFLRRHLFF